MFLLRVRRLGVRRSGFGFSWGSGSFLVVLTGGGCLGEFI